MAVVLRMALEKGDAALPLSGTSRGFPRERMNLLDIYKIEGFEGLCLLAEAVGASPKYLYQCAIGRRQPSAAMVVRLCKADHRLTREDLRPDIFGKDSW